MNDYTIYLNNPAGQWDNASPVGCGRLGAMIYGIPGTERIQINEERIWAGKKMEDILSPEFHEKFMTVRRMLLNGRPGEADKWAIEHMAGDFHRIKSYETAGDLFVDTGDGDSDGPAENYSRRLDLISGVCGTEYSRGGRLYRRRYVASYPDSVIVCRFEGLDPNRRVRLRYERENIKSIGAENAVMRVEAATADDLHRFTVLIKAVTTGRTASVDGGMEITGADDLVLIITAAVGKEPVFPAASDWETLLSRAEKDHRELMKRSEIVFETDPELERMTIPQRLERVRGGGTDAGLLSLYYQFGRYLLVGSSRPGSLPANLQGVWNGDMKAAWNADYHTNINLQMNYWPVETANLAECALPLFDYMNSNLLESGKETARILYRCRGTVTHHVSDIYGFTAPCAGPWGMWPMGGAWLCLNMWEHYQYSGDTGFLAETAYEFIKQSVIFFLDYMFESVEDGKNVLLTGPSTSPENTYFDSEGRRCSLCLSPTMDVEIVGCLLKIYIETENILGRDPALRSEAEAALGKLPPLKIGRKGNLSEWREDYDEPEPGHRHISHLFALYPDSAINSDTPELLEAARRTIERRLEHGGGHTGWSCAWLINMYARLGDGEGVSGMLRKLLCDSTLDNLFDTHPPFQIDGNFGAAAGIAEALLQSHNGVISLLPATPREFRSGSFSGMRARGGLTVSAEWKDGIVTSAVIHASKDAAFTIKMNGEERKIAMKAGDTLRI